MHCSAFFDSANRVGSSTVAVDALDEVSRASARRMGLCAYPTRFGSCCRCAWQPAVLSDDIASDSAQRTEEARGEAEGGPHRDPGKQAGVRRGPLLRFSGGTIADSRAYRTAGYDGSDHAERSREPARLRFLVLPLCFPGSDVWGGEAANSPEGPFEVINFLKKNWSGRRDSNPRPQPWQGCAPPRGH